MSTSSLTLGDVIPSSEKNKYSSIANIPLSTAVAYAMQGIPGNLTPDQADAIDELFQDYQDNGGSDGGNAYWNKNPQEAEAYWNKNPDPAYWNKESDDAPDAYWNKEA